MKTDLFLVFDVESIGLHGEAFAVGWCVVNRAGERLTEGLLACSPSTAVGTEKNREWVTDEVPPLDTYCTNPHEVRTRFWEEIWLSWKAKGAVLVADCGWPVESRFLAACVDDDPDNREWQGPYPFLDLATVLLMHGKHINDDFGHLPDELPPHHPLNDARQSARVLLEHLR